MDCAESADERRLRHELARLTYWGCIRSGVTNPAGEAGLPSAPEVTRHVPAPAKRGLDALPDKERAAIALCLYGAHTYQEAADLLALPAEAVAHLLSLGLRKVGPLLEASQPAPGGHSAD